MSRFLRIASRVAAGRKNSVDPLQVRRAIEDALRELQTQKKGTEVGIGSGPIFDTLLKDYEYFATMREEDGKIRIFSTVHHDTEIVFEVPVSSFDVDLATSALVGDIEAGMDQFDEMFPEEPAAP